MSAIFVYVASFGAFTRTSYTASQDVKNALGHFAYILEGLQDLDTLRPYQVRITADGETLDGEYLFGAVCQLHLHRRYDEAGAGGGHSG